VVQGGLRDVKGVEPGEGVCLKGGGEKTRESNVNTVNFAVGVHQGGQKRMAGLGSREKIKHGERAMVKIQGFGRGI